MKDQKANRRDRNHEPKSKIRNLLLNLGLSLGLLPIAFWVVSGAGASPADSVDQGKTTFQSICSVCHTIGGGVKVGPDLEGITDQRSAAWLTNFISNPDKMIKSGDPIATGLLKKFNGLEMPNLGLSSEQVSDLIAYLRSTGAPLKAQVSQPKTQPLAPPAQAPAPQAAQPAASPAGSAEAGERVFTGLIPLQKGGPPCFSCHDVASISFPGGGSLGPDLTGVYAKFGATSMNSMLATLPFPTMRPIFDRRPLTLQEQQDLEAFFQKAGVRSLISRGVEVGLAAAGGLIILIILAWIIWRNRLGSVRKALVR